MATASSPSPRPVFTSPSPLAFATTTSPSPSQHSTTSPTPPPRPPSSPGISVFAPRPMRIPMYRPQFSRPVFLYDSETTEKENQLSGPTNSATRRSSVASTGIPEESLDSKIIYSPSKDVLEELFKIVRPTSASSASTNTSAVPPATSSPSASFARPQPLHPRSPNASHRRNTSDASDGGLSSILGGLSVLNAQNPRASPDTDWRNMRTAVSPVARRAIGNPMIRDPSFQGETPKKDS
ncbi:hypothetical protein TWF694_002846 [Orbilia ellipsospora]|uniref:Uncharacterized protein n=1 Tax=Orbilia ellipsospora TaxID=2528407 RepID=A0AAV9WZY3_9PEZI